MLLGFAAPIHLVMADLQSRAPRARARTAREKTSALRARKANTPEATAPFAFRQDWSHSRCVLVCCLTAACLQCPRGFYTNRANQTACNACTAEGLKCDNGKAGEPFGSSPLRNTVNHLLSVTQRGFFAYTNDDGLIETVSATR